MQRVLLCVLSYGMTDSSVGLTKDSTLWEEWEVTQVHSATSRVMFAAAKSHSYVELQLAAQQEPYSAVTDATWASSLSNDSSVHSQNVRHLQRQCHARSVL